MKEMKAQFEEILRNEQEEKNKIITELQKIREEGLLLESTKTDIQNIKDICGWHAEQSNEMNQKFDNIAQILQQLKENNKVHMEMEKQND